MPDWPRNVEKVGNHGPVVGHRHRVVDGRLGPEEDPLEVCRGADALVGETLEGRQLLDQRLQFRKVLLLRRADHTLRARLAADTTAAREASRMEESRPTPHQVDPSGPAHST
jgi:hypothetical protein